MKLIARAAAEQDTADAFDYYEAQEDGLGAKFIDALESAFDQIRRTPSTFRIFRGRTRKFTMRGYPYAIFYMIEADHISVLSIFHGSRHPRKLRARLDHESRSTE